MSTLRRRRLRGSLLSLRTALFRLDGGRARGRRLSSRGLRPATLRLLRWRRRRIFGGHGPRTLLRSGAGRGRWRLIAKGAPTAVGGWLWLRSRRGLLRSGGGLLRSGRRLLRSGRGLLRSGRGLRLSRRGLGAPRRRPGGGGWNLANLSRVHHPNRLRTGGDPALQVLDLRRGEWAATVLGDPGLLPGEGNGRGRRSSAGNHGAVCNAGRGPVRGSGSASENAGGLWSETRRRTDAGCGQLAP